MADTTMFHPRTLLENPANAYEALTNALLNHLTGRPEGAQRFERFARSCPGYTEEVFRHYLFALAKRQLIFQENPGAAFLTLSRGVPAGLNRSPLGLAFAAVTFAEMHYRLGDMRAGLRWHLLAVLCLKTK